MGTARDADVLHLRLVPDLDAVSNDASCYIHVQNADAWHAAMAKRGLALREIADRPWGMREFSVVDPFGTVIRVGHNL
ncbi:MAG: hypothetical protein ACE5GC_07935 [Acidimicrobiia bacterium]